MFQSFSLLSQQDNPADSVNLRANYYSDRALESFNEGNYPLALEQDKKAILYFEKLNDEIAVAKIKSHIGDIYFKINDYDNSLKNYLDALQLFEKNKAYDLVNKTKHTIGDLYLRLEQCDPAFKFLFQSMRYYNEDTVTYKAYLPGIHQSLGIAYGRCSSLDSALYHFKRAIEAIGQYDTTSFSGGLLNNIGAIYSKKEENEKALEYYNKSLLLFQKLNLKQGIGVSVSNIAYIYKKQKKLEESLTLYLEALNIFSETNSLIYLKDNYLNISEVYEETGDLKNALKYNNLYLDLNDSITNSEILSRMGELQIQFEIRKKEQELLLLEKEKLIVEQENEIAEIRQYLLIGGILLLIILSGLVFRNLRVSLYNTRLKQQVLKQEKDQLSQELDFINSELESFALKIVEKNDLLVSLKNKIKKLNLKEVSNTDQLKEISNSINSNLYIEKDRKEFQLQLDKSHQSFFLKLDNKYPDLTKNERRLCSLIVLELSSKDIATILNISMDGVKKSRHRLRKKLDLDSETNLSDHLKSL
ncbi:MAG: tetratricopeptide repeat protein [Flavobacteriales bacterium]|nr:tetratricopeptide repeat protein [Flavobacteriales bacterium]